MEDYKEVLERIAEHLRVIKFGLVLIVFMIIANFVYGVYVGGMAAQSAKPVNITYEQLLAP